MIFKSILFLIAVFSCNSWAQLNVVVSVPDFKEIFESIGKEKVKVISLLNGREDPHFIDAVPSFISKVAKADIVCAVGLHLEIGWLPKVLAKSANSKVQMGGRGYCELGESVTILEKPTQNFDRSMGDVHGGGNPHFYLSPSALNEAASKVASILSLHLPAGKEYFMSNLKDFQLRMKLLKKSIAAKLAPLQNIKLIQFHKEFSYFISEYGFNSFGAIEEKPGVPPSSARILNVSFNAKKSSVRLAIGSFHTPVNYLKKFTEISGIPYVKLPASLQLRDPKLNTIAKVQNYIASKIIQSVHSATHNSAKLK